MYCWDCESLNLFLKWCKSAHTDWKQTPWFDEIIMVTHSVASDSHLWGYYSAVRLTPTGLTCQTHVSVSTVKLSWRQRTVTVCATLSVQHTQLCKHWSVNKAPLVMKVSHMLTSNCCRQMPSKATEHFTEKATAFPVFPLPTCVD